MSTKLPAAIPQVPVLDLDRAIAYYQSQLGFTVDWKYEEGLAGVSCGETRLFLDRVVDGSVHPVRIWLNFCSTAEVDSLHRDWKKSGATILSAPEQKPWRLYEFTAEDCDGNSFRVFHDTGTPANKA